MSLGDYLRYLRAVHGGESTQDIATKLGLPSPWPINEIEQRYRDCGDNELVARLAEYYGVPVEEMQWRRRRSRKALTAFLSEAQDNAHTIVLVLRNEERLIGTVEWFDMGAILLKPLDDEKRDIMVQRHIVDDWEMA
ncbi:MAG: hypothetical protein GXY76_01205 [Chloroflexi bacterium]|nr:hypothetical protein [Chloroflexota bacterium]